MTRHKKSLKRTYLGGSRLLNLRRKRAHDNVNSHGRRAQSSLTFWRCLV